MIGDMGLNTGVARLLRVESRKDTATVFYSKAAISTNDLISPKTNHSTTVDGG